MSQIARFREGNVARVAMLVAALALIWTVVVIAGPSEAHAVDRCVRHPAEPSVACVRTDLRSLDVCDRDTDDHYVYARYRFRGQPVGTFHSTGYDSNGSTSGCLNLRFSGYLESVAVCTQYEGCSAFMRLPW